MISGVTEYSEELMTLFWIKDRLYPPKKIVDINQGDEHSAALRWLLSC